jgi:hypothetical protein
MLVTIKTIDAQQSHLYVTNRSGGPRISGVKVEVLVRTNGGEQVELVSAASAAPIMCCWHAIGAVNHGQQPNTPTEASRKVERHFPPASM